jgi:hypothetical protein
MTDRPYWCEICARKKECYGITLKPKCFVPTADRKTESDSEKPNNCKDFFREPTAEERKAVADYIDSISVPTGVNIFDLMDEPTISKMEQVDKDINVRSKDEARIITDGTYLYAYDKMFGEWRPIQDISGHKQTERSSE